MVKRFRLCKGKVQTFVDEDITNDREKGNYFAAFIYQQEKFEHFMNI